MRPLSEQGLELNAEVTAQVRADGVDLTIHAWSGRRNADYGLAVNLCLTRLGLLGAKLKSVSVASDNPKIPADSDRHLRLPDFQLPMDLAALGDVDALRVAVGREVAAEGRTPHAGPGGNPSKKIRIVCDAVCGEWQEGLDVVGFLRTGVRYERAPAPAAPDLWIGPGRPRIFATLNWGFDPAVWGALGFSNAKVRNALAGELRSGGCLVLSIGTRGPETPEHQRGRLLALLDVGVQAIETQAMVDPGRWQLHLNGNRGAPKWPYGLPIAAAESFVDPPHGSAILPRFDEENLHIVLATNYRELTPQEVDRILALPRAPVPQIYRTPQAAFAVKLRTRPGPPPGPRGTRVLRADSGPAATYCFILEGDMAAEFATRCGGGRLGLGVFKVGYSNSPERRGRELNAYLPHDASLRWRLFLEQWHEDEINAWAMEQMTFDLLRQLGGDRFKGEMVSAPSALITNAWTRARSETVRPETPVVVLEQ